MISFKTHLLGLPWDPSCRRSETSTSGLCKAAASREVDQDPEGGLTRPCNARPSLLIMCCAYETPSQVDVTFHNDYNEPELPEHKSTLPSTMSTTSPSCLSMRCRCQRMRMRRASLVSSVKTRSVQDTILSRHDLSRHISRCLFLSHTPCQFLR